MIQMGVSDPLFSRRPVYVVVERRRGSGVLMQSWPTPNGLASEATAMLLLISDGRPELHWHHPPTFLRVELLRRRPWAG